MTRSQPLRVKIDCCIAISRRDDGDLVDLAERLGERQRDPLERLAAARDDLTAEERTYLERRLSGPGPAALGRSGDEALRANDPRKRRRNS